MPRRSFIALRHTGREWVVLGTSLAITLLLTVYLYGGLRRTLEIERRVIERTRQLSAEVAERRRAEASARLAEAKYRGIFENSVEGIFQTSLDGKYISANRSLARIYGYESADQLITDLSNIAIQLYVQSGRRDEFSNLIRKCGTVAGFESQVFRKDGTVIWISESARTVSDERGHLLYYEGAVIDISERKSAESDREREHDELEERVRERTEALAAANAAKSRFLASMSHEIRTPMNAILGYAQLLRRDPTLRDTQRDAMSTIVSSGNHLLGLIDDILDLSRIEAGHLELQPSNFDLPTMVTDLANMFRQRCDQKGLSLQIDLPSECRELVRGDEQKLRQVLVNLLGNAIRFTDAGTVTLSVRRHTSIACGFEVFDTGIGIPNDSMAQIFEAFQQADGHGRGGSGLGLAIARQHVRLMGGELFVESTVGIGSRFHFVVSLPASDEAIEENRGTVGTITRLAEGHAVNAVIIDDVRENRLVLAEMLTSIGCQATSFSSGIAAIESFSHSRAERPDIIFLDTLMPELDGIATARALQKMSSLDGVRLVATSAAAGAHQQDRYAVAGFHDVLIKPIVCERLYAVLASQLGVQFEYGSVAIDPETQDTKARPSHRITTEVARLSISLRDRLRRTAELCGITELRQCAEELERSEPPAIYLARSVRACLQTYDTLPLLQVLATADTQSSDGLDPTPTGAGA